MHETPLTSAKLWSRRYNVLLPLDQLSDDEFDRVAEWNRHPRTQAAAERAQNRRMESEHRAFVHWPSVDAQRSR